VLDVVRAWLFPSACAGCDRPGPALCGACAPGAADAVRFLLDGIPAFALGSYEGALRRAVVAMKRGERDPLAVFAQLLAAAPVDGTLVPLPTSRARADGRGFDQAVVLARLVARERGIPLAEVLVKRGGAQEGRGRHARLAATDRFRVRADVTLPAEVTLLDDVCTTGATLRDAARTLVAAGVVVRRIAVIARSGGTPASPLRS
jgi:predicted amidophosphoribosyltransferase